jgi:hypothetical protein
VLFVGFLSVLLCVGFVLIIFFVHVGVICVGCAIFFDYHGCYVMPVVWCVELVVSLLDFFFRDWEDHADAFDNFLSLIWLNLVTDGSALYRYDGLWLFRFWWVCVVEVVSAWLVGGRLVSVGFGRNVISLAAFLRQHSLLSARCSLLQLVHLSCGH